MLYSVVCLHSYPFVFLYFILKSFHLLANNHSVAAALHSPSVLFKRSLATVSPAAHYVGLYLCLRPPCAPLVFPPVSSSVVSFCRHVSVCPLINHFLFKPLSSQCLPAFGSNPTSTVTFIYLLVVNFNNLETI